MERMMTQREFNDDVVLARCDLELLKTADERKAKAFRRAIIGIVKDVKQSFRDKENNFINWLNGKPCTFIHPRTGNRVEVKIGDDYEAIYCFLIYCAELYGGEKIEDDFADYLAYVINRSVHETGEC